jgi:hypothetical protein
LFTSIGRALTYKDQISFALSVATDLSISERRLGQEELNILLKPPKVIRTQAPAPISLSLPALKHVPQTIISSREQIKEWYKSHSIALPMHQRKSHRVPVPPFTKRTETGNIRIGS